MTIKQHGGIFGRNPSFNSVEVESLTVAGNVVPDASTILVDGDIGSTVQGYDADTAKLDAAQTFTASQTFNENIVMANTKGIDFSATAGTGTSELFDDYEEGTWTPVIGGSGGQSGQSYSIQQGNYTKIGDQVICHFRARFDGTSGAKGTITTYVNIQGLPFTSNNSSLNYRSGGFCFVWSGMTTSVTTINLGMENNSTTAVLQVITSAATTTSLIQTADVSDSLQLQGFISYKV